MCGNHIYILPMYCGQYNCQYCELWTYELQYEVSVIYAVVIENFGCDWNFTNTLFNHIIWL